MANLQLAVNGEYFDAMKRGEKTEEYRLYTDYWMKRLVGECWDEEMITGRCFDRLIITRGYPRKDDADRRIDIKYTGFDIKTITHPHFGPDPVKVFAIKVKL